MALFDTSVNGVNQSLAALCGYVILGGEQGAVKRSKTERKQAWQHIADAMISLDSLSGSLDDESTQIINQIRPLLADITLPNTNRRHCPNVTKSTCC